MTKILLSTFVLFFALSASATKPTKVNYLTDKYMKIINLEGLQLTNEEGSNELFYKIAKGEELSKQVVQTLEEETQTSILSEVHLLAEHSSFANIYVFVGKIKADNPSEFKYVLNVVYDNGNGSLAAVDYDIVKASAGKLLLQNGPSGSISNVTATIKNGSFFPY